MSPTPAPARFPRHVLALAGLLAAVGAVLAAVGLIVDPGRITGSPQWLKPLRFGVSIAVYCASVAWLLPLVDATRRVVRWCAAVTSAALLLELALIDTQAARGTTSHFNVHTSFDAAITAIMGGAVVVPFVAACVLAVLVLRRPGPATPVVVGARAALVLCVLGMAEAVLMVVQGAHTVGAADGGPGLWLTGWSTGHGDLRVAHFAGLHALELFLGLGWLIGRRPARRDHGPTITIAAGWYAGLVALLTWQALRGEPVVHPSPLVAAVAAVWTAAALMTASILLPRRSVRPVPVWS